jgi:hypothetical protein
MTLDPQTVRATLNALAAVGATDLYDRVDFARQTDHDTDYAQLLANAVAAINEEYAE